MIVRIFVSVVRLSLCSTIDSLICILCVGMCKCKHMHVTHLYSFVRRHSGRRKREGNIGRETADRCVRLVRNLNIATRADNCTLLPPFALHSS